MNVNYISYDATEFSCLYNYNSYIEFIIKIILKNYSLIIEWFRGTILRCVQLDLMVRWLGKYSDKN